MPLFLSPPFDQLWKDKDPFQEAFALKGKVYREIEARKTLRFEINGQGYFVKLHRGVGWWPILREWLKGRSPVIGAQTEYDALALLEKVGVHSMHPVAFGSKGANPAKQRSFLITQELGNTISLEDFCKDWPTSPPEPALKRALITEVATMVRKMHAAGMNHRDCYLVHFLLHTNSLPTPKISLIDLHRAQIRPQVPQRWRNKDLAALAYSSSNIGLDFKDQCRFLKTYFQKPLRDIFRQEKPLLYFLKAETARLIQRWGQKFSETALKSQALQQGMWINPRYAALLEKQGITVANAFDYFWNLKLDREDVPNTGRSGVSEVCHMQLGGLKIYLKRQTMHLRYSLTAPFGEPTFAHEFRNLQKFPKLGITVPEVIFFGQKSLPGKPKSAVLITRSLNQHYEPFSQLLQHWNDLAEETKARALQATSYLFERLHSAGLIHNSLYPKHVFIAKDPAHTPQAVLIDLEKVRLAILPGAKQKDLDRFYRHCPTPDCPILQPDDLIKLGRKLTAPFQLALGQVNEALRITEIYRLLPAKRLTGKAISAKHSTVIAKLFLDNSAQSRCEAETNGLGLLMQAGIPAPRVLAQENLDGQGCALLTEYLSDSETLADRLGKPLCIMAKTHARPSNTEISEWLTQAVLLLAKLHSAKLIHTDLHFANLLFSGEALYLLDGDAVKTAANEKELQHNLAEFFAQLSVSLDGLRPALIKAYLQKKSPQSATPHNTGQLEKEIDRVRAWRCEDILNKVTRDCTLFSVTKTFTRFTACARDNSEWLAPLLNTPDDFMQANVIKRGNTCTVARATLGGHALVIKRYNIKSTWHWLTRFWRPSRAWHSWLSAHRLKFWAIPTPEPIALIEERLGPVRKRAWYVSEEVQGPNMAEHLAQVAATTPVPDSEKKSLQDLFGQLIKRRITHGDMKATNFIWSDDHWVLIDLDSVTAHKTEQGFQKAWHKDQDRFRANWNKDPWGHSQG